LPTFFKFNLRLQEKRVIVLVQLDQNLLTSSTHYDENHYNTNNLSYYTLYPKSQKPIKAVIRHLPQNTPAEDMHDGLVDLGFYVINVKQMSIASRSPEGTTSITLPLFLVTLPRMAKS
jgi:hypothetical protein